MDQDFVEDQDYLEDDYEGWGEDSRVWDLYQDY